MNYRSLGPVEASVGGARIRIGGPRQQIVLSLLLSAAGQVVPLHTLVDAIWGDEPPATARGQIYITISKLRHRLEVGPPGPVIETRAPGYALPMSADDTSDLLLFDELVEAGLRAGAADDAKAAAADLRAALDLWRGEPFGGLGATSAPLRDLTHALWERRAAVGAALVEFEFALGRHAEVINDLRREVERNPLAERTRGQLMIALHGAGRQAEALREYRIAREVLVEELGIEPGPQLREIERRILAGDAPPALRGSVVTTSAPLRDTPDPTPPHASPGSDQEVTRGVPRMLPPGISDFVGRERELDILAATLSTNAVGPAGRTVSTAPVAVVIGSAGVGKSTLAVEAARRLTQAFSDGQLYADLHGGRRRGDVGVLERFLRALGVPGHAIPEDVEQRLDLYRQLLSERRVLVVLDDAWSEEQIAPLLPGSGTCAVLATSRRRLTGVPGALLVDLAPFRQDESIRLLSRALGEERVGADPTSAAELALCCGNLPLAVRIAAARLAARPSWSLAEIADRLATGSPLDELHHGEMAVRDSVLVSYHQLAPPVRHLFRMLGLIDAPDFGEWLARPLHGDERTRYPEDMLAVLVEIHLVDVTITDDGSARYSLHDLVRAVARERAAVEDPTDERFAALRRAFQVLLGLLDAAHEATLGGEYLVVRGETERGPVPERNLPEVTRAPLAWLARETRFIVAAVVGSATMGLPGLAWELALRAAVGFEANNDLDAWRETHVAARIAVETHGDGLGLAAMDYSLGSLSALAHDLARADELLSSADAGFRELRRPEGAALVHRCQAFVALQRGDLRGVAQLAEPALRTFRGNGDILGESSVLRVLADRAAALGDLTTAIDQLEEAVALCRRTGNRRVTALSLQQLGMARLATGEPEAGCALFVTALGLVTETDDPLVEALALLGIATAARQQGAIGNAREILARAEEIVLTAGDWRARALIRLECGRVLDADGQHAAAVRKLQAAAAVFRTLVLPLHEVETLMELGDVHRRRGLHVSALQHWRDGLALLDSLDGSAGARLHHELTQRLTATSITT